MITLLRPCLLVLFAGITNAENTSPLRFDFGTSRVADQAIAVEPSSSFTRERGHGFELGAIPAAVDRGGDPFSGDFLTSNAGFIFSVELPEGNYDVGVLLGDSKGASDTTIKAESRRLMVEKAVTADGRQVTRKFTVNIRRPGMEDGSRVSLKQREKDYLHWDSKLTLEFNGPRPCVAGLSITPAPDATTVWLLGDSTVTDQPYEPWGSWGQMLPRFFQEGVAVANHAESGESLLSSLGARRVAKVISGLRKGDYVLIQFGHNDMKDRREGALDRYGSNLAQLVDDIRKKEATPVLLTSMERKAGVQKDTLSGYPDTVRRVAGEKNTVLIDLHSMSRKLYAGLGGQLDAAFQDGTHHNNFGSYQLAKCVVEGIRANIPELANRLTDDVKPFDPAKPDDPSVFVMPASPMKDPGKPDGD